MATFDVVVGFVGVALGTVATSGLTIYKERFTARREREAREATASSRCSRPFPTSSGPCTTSRTGCSWRWTPQAGGPPERGRRSPPPGGPTRSAAWRCSRHVSSTTSIPGLAARIRTTSREAVWAPTVDEAKAADIALSGLVREFDEKVRSALPGLYVP